MAAFVIGHCSSRLSGSRQLVVCEVAVTRRELLLGAIAVAVAAKGELPVVSHGALTLAAQLEGQTPQKGRIAGKPATVYPDFTLTESGLQYKDARVGKGEFPRDGDRAVIDWEGYTLGHEGRPFAAKNKVKGGDFQGDQDFFRWVVGENTVIPALDEAVRSMKQGGIRQVVIPPELGYPGWDPKHKTVGPKPKTFAGQQRLDFVLNSKGYVDSTLLINLELVRIDRPGERGFRR